MGRHTSVRDIFADNRRVFVIGEVAQAHDGSLGTAHAFIDAIAEGGADAVKFQTHIAEEESSPDEPWRVAFSRQDASRFDYWKRIEFTREEWSGLAEHCAQRGVVFLSSPFSTMAVDWLEEMGMAAWKVASGEVTNDVLLSKIIETKKPVLLSTGMSTWKEIDWGVSRLKEAGVEFALLQGTTAYPCPPEMMGLELLEEMGERHGCPVGLSDHSGTIYPGVAAAALGAKVLEVHVTMHGKMFGPDVPASLDLEDLGRLVEGVRFVEAMRANPVDKDAFAEKTAELKEMFGQSLVAATDLEAGTELTGEHIGSQKPNNGIPASRREELIGRVLKEALGKGERFSFELLN